MHRAQSRTNPTHIILRRHQALLLVKLSSITTIWIVIVVASVLIGAPRLALIVTVIAAGSGGLVIAGWRVFSVNIRYDRILVRKLHFGTIEETIYAIPGMRGLTRRQGVVGRLFDVGTLTLQLPDRAIRLSMLTPFSAIAGALGFDC